MFSGIGFDDKRPVEARRSENRFGSHGVDEGTDGRLAFGRLRDGGDVNAISSEVMQRNSNLAEARYEAFVVGDKAEERADLLKRVD